MSARQVFPDPRAEMVPAVPDGIESPEAKLVYVYLDATTGATVDELVDHLGLTRLALFPVLETLEDKGLIGCDGPLYVAS